MGNAEDSEGVQATKVTACLLIAAPSARCNGVWHASAAGALTVTGRPGRELVLADGVFPVGETEWKMLGSLHLVGEATRVRELALTVRRLANVLSRDIDRHQLRQHAEQLEAQATSLEAAAKSSHRSKRDLAAIR